MPRFVIKLPYVSQCHLFEFKAVSVHSGWLTIRSVLMLPLWLEHAWLQLFCSWRIRDLRDVGWYSFPCTWRTSGRCFSIGHRKPDTSGACLLEGIVAFLLNFLTFGSMNLVDRLSSHVNTYLIFLCLPEEMLYRGALWYSRSLIFMHIRPPNKDLFLESSVLWNRLNVFLHLLTYILNLLPVLLSTAWV